MRDYQGLRVAGPALVMALIGTTSALATEGYFLGGYGALQSSLAGAGVANPSDAMTQTLNPAGLVDVDRQFNIGVSAFAPSRGYDASNTGFVAPGSHSSSIPLFLIPNMAYTQPIDATSSWGVAVFGNGGMNTDYRGVANLAPGCLGPQPGQGVFCGGKAGVNLSQGFLQATYAKRFGDFSFGISPVLAMQVFSAEGLGAFAGNSAYAPSMQNPGADLSEGVGLRAGAEWRTAPNFRIGIAGATPTYMTKFSKYKGLFADQGSFDIPGFITAGIAYDAVPALTLMADYKHIFYSNVAAVGNSSQVAAQFGSTGGPGFGWRDVDVIAFGAEWRAMPKLTLRAGAEFNTNPVTSRNVTLNILAPGVTTSQYSAGLSYRVTANSSLDLAAYYAANGGASGPVPVAQGGGNVKLSLSETMVTLGWTYHFDADASPIKANF